MITIVTSVTVDKIYEENLKRTLDQQDIEFELILADAEKKLFESYNEVKEVKGKYILFIHQDMNLLTKDWLRKAEEYCDKLKDLGAAGIAGWQDNKLHGISGYFVASYRGKGKNIEYFGKTLKGRLRGKPFTEPIIVGTLDDMVLIVPTKVWKEVKFDDVNFKFHMAGFDYCFALRDRGLKLYVLPLQTFENSITSFSSKYFKKHGRQKTWLPVLAMKWEGKFKTAGSYDLRKWQAPQKKKG